jgi:methyl-accepting chemotaxis protein
VIILMGAWFLIRAIRRPLARANAAAARIAQGDLSEDICSSRKDEFGVLINSLGAMNTALASMVSQVRDCSTSIASASEEIAVGNNDLSVRTDSTASSLQETSRADFLHDRGGHVGGGQAACGGEAAIGA